MLALVLLGRQLYATLDSGCSVVYNSALPPFVRLQIHGGRSVGFRGRLVV